MKTYEEAIDFLFEEDFTKYWPRSTGWSQSAYVIANIYEESVEKVFRDIGKEHDRLAAIVAENRRQESREANEQRKLANLAKKV